MDRIHEPPFEVGFRLYKPDDHYIRSWKTAPIFSFSHLPRGFCIFNWCSENLIGEFSITPKGMAFEMPEDALRYQLQFGGNGK